MNLKISELSESEFQNLEAEWVALCKKSAVTPFQFPQWLIPWWCHFGGSELKAITFRSLGNLVGLAPLFIYEDEHQVRKLCLIGSGISDYLDIIISKEYEDSVGSAFLEYLHDIKGEWDIVDFHDVTEAGYLLHLVYPKWMNTKIEEHNVCSYVKLSENKNIRCILPKKLRKNVAHAARELKKNGSYTLETATNNTRDLFLDNLISLHRVRWESKNKTGVLNTDTLYSFHRQATEKLFKSDLFQIYSLQYNQKVIAVYYTLKYNKNMYIYLGGFDPSMEKYSPGSLALYHIMEDALKQGLEVFDFLRGEEWYKSLWAPFYRYNYRIRIEGRV